MNFILNFLYYNRLVSEKSITCVGMYIINIKGKIPIKDIIYSLYLYVLGLSYSNTTARALQRFVHLMDVSVYVNRFKNTYCKDYQIKRKKTKDFYPNKTFIKIGPRYVRI